MAITIDQAKQIGDKKLRFGRSEGGVSLRGEIKAVLVAAFSKGRAVNAEETAKIVGPKLNLTVDAELTKKVGVGLEDLKYAGHAARAVDDKGTKHYYLVEKPAKQ